jgi:predicted DNA-binding protein
VASPYSPPDDEEPENRNETEYDESTGLPRRKSRRKNVAYENDEERLFGRIMGPLKRSRPELYNALTEMEKSTGKRKTIILSEALHHYILERKVIQSQLSLAELYEAWEFLADLQEHAIRNFIRLGSLLFSEEYQGMLELSRAIHGEIKAEAPSVPVELPPKAKDITQRLVDKIWKFAEPLMDWCLESAAKNMAKAMGAKEPPLKFGEKIPVEIVEESE